MPALTTARTLFTPVLFPVAAVVPPGPYDDIFIEVENYDDGFAKAVHAVQPEYLDPLQETDDGTRPAKDIGVRLGWDDEQVAIWMNRQIDPAAAPLDAPMGVQGYRIDAREHGAVNWSSLCLAKGVVKAGSKIVGNFDGELAIETIPSQPDGNTTGVYWLPSYYTNWTGPSLVASDTLTRRLVGDPNWNAPNPVDGVAPAVKLLYGKTYDFRVRLMDHTGGGPDINGSPRDPSPSPVYTIPFRRWIRPGTVKIVEKLPSVPNPAKAPDKIHIGRPLLGHPEYDFTGAPNAAADLIADIPAAKAERREVALPDPDVAILQITVEVRALGLDNLPGGGGDDSGFHIVYKTTRPFPTDPKTPLELDFTWQDVKQVDSLAPPATGPIPLPTARDVRLVLAAKRRTIRSSSTSAPTTSATVQELRCSCASSLRTNAVFCCPRHRATCCAQTSSNLIRPFFRQSPSRSGLPDSAYRRPQTLSDA